MRKHSGGKKTISGIKVHKKEKQKGGLAALNMPKKPQIRGSHRTPKIFIGLSKKYLRAQNESVEITLAHIENILNTEETDRAFNKVAEFIKERKCLSSQNIEENTISMTAWVQGPPTYNLFYGDYNIDEEEKTSLSLLTLVLKKDKGNITYSLHHNGIVISIHAIARLIQRMGYQSEHLSIKKEIDQIIPWGAMNSSLTSNGLSFMRQLVAPSNHGVWFGSMCVVNDRTRDNTNASVYFVRTFVSEGLMTDNQLERLEELRDDEDVITDDLRQAVIKYLEYLVSPGDDVALQGLIKVIDAQDDFYSEDKFIDRVEPFLSENQVDFEALKKGGVDFIDFNKSFNAYRMVEKANV